MTSTPGAAALSVTVLGCSGSYASADNPCTGYLVRSPGATVLLDCGPGTLGPLQATIDLNDLTAIVTTHCHPDHWLELPVIRNVFTWFQPRGGVPVYGTAETRAMDQRIATRPRDPRPDPLEWTVVCEGDHTEIGDQHWSFAATDHPVETLAVRVDCGGRSFAFSADTGPDWDFRSLGEGINVAMCDATHGCAEEGRGIPHMSAREAAGAALVAGADRLVLTHLAPGSDPEARLAEARAAFCGPVEVARPGLVLQV